MRLLIASNGSQYILTRQAVECRQTDENKPMRPPDHFADDLPKTLELHSALAPKLVRCITPIAATVESTTFQLGTGTFFRAADYSFLVTAAHVLRKAKKLGAQIRLLDGESTDRCVKYQDVPLRKWTAYIGKEPADIGIIPLEREVVSELANRWFLRLDEVAIRPSVPGGCWVMGYPAETVAYSDAGRQMTYSPFLLAAPLVEPNASLENFDQDYHLLLNAGRDDLWWPDGTPARMPSQLGGISGCPVWQVVWPDGRWQPEHVRIVGVQTAHYPRRSLIKATHWGAVAVVLGEYCPDLRGIIEMHLGR